MRASAAPLHLTMIGFVLTIPPAVTCRLLIPNNLGGIEWNRMTIERDLHFQPGPFSKVIEQYRRERGQ